VKPPELLAPAGSLLMVRTALDFGADADLRRPAALQPARAQQRVSAMKSPRWVASI
jgi:hypothetical protein